MKQTLTLSQRGTLTLPKALRERYALKSDDLIIAEETAEGILLRPATAVPVEMYTDTRIREFEEGEKELEAYLRKKRK